MRKICLPISSWLYFLTALVATLDLLTPTSEIYSSIIDMNIRLTYSHC